MLLRTTPEIIAATSAGSSSLDMTTLRPCIALAEENNLLPYIGQPLYDRLNTAYNTPTDAEADLIKKIQTVLAPAALYAFAPMAEANITESGIFRHETDNSKTAYQQQVANLRRQLQLEVDQNTESLLRYLEANKATFPEWQASPQFAQYRSLFIKTGAEFEKMYHTAAPWRNYLSLQPILQEAELLALQPILGSAFFAELKTLIAQPDFDITTTDAERDAILTPTLYFYICKYVAYSALIMASAALQLTIDDSGVTIYTSQGRSTNDADSKRGPATPDYINHWLLRMQEAASQWRKTLSFYLSQTASISVFSTWYNWQQSIAPPTPTCPPPGNTFSM